jgi:FtsP/CotA-like multicopper oxidase with cupredoxin domain
LNEVRAENKNSLALLLNGQTWSAPVSEKPLVGSTEDWELVNVTSDTHPIHVHLVQFQIVSRQAFEKDRFQAEWMALNGKLPLSHPTKELQVEGFLIGSPKPPEPNERGWHDIVHANPGEITTIRIRFAPIDTKGNKVKPGENKYPFNPGQFTGYVWHCHVLEHEDNEMMRPYEVSVPSDKNKRTIGSIVKRILPFFRRP